MTASLPYLSSPGSIKTALERIRAAATPDRVTRDFVETKLQIKGGTGAALIPFLKKIGFVATDGSPTDLYKRFRNPSAGGAAIADSIKRSYGALGAVREYFYDLSDKELLDLIVQVTGLEKDDAVAKMTFSTLKNLKGFAKFDASDGEEEQAAMGAGVAKLNEDARQSSGQPEKRLGLNLAYTINLNLPATSDQAVFNAIFRSLKEHLLANE
jgi:Family of unknown function (DUF5343)